MLVVIDSTDMLEVVTYYLDMLVVIEPTFTCATNMLEVLTLYLGMLVVIE